jgi:hypothetical protein
MRTDLCDRFGIDYPIFVFTPSEKVAAAVSRAGGLGVLGCVRFNEPDDLETVLGWMDNNTDGKPYGVDIVMPAKVPTEGTAVDINKLIPQSHREFVAKTLADLGVPPLPDDEERNEGVLGWLHSVARSHVEVALKHPIKLIANALGSPPRDVIDRAHEAGVPVDALAGRATDAQRHVDNGVDIVVAQATRPADTPARSGRWCWAEIIDELRALGHQNPEVMAMASAGRQVAAALALARKASGWLAFHRRIRLGHRKPAAFRRSEALLRANSAIPCAAASTPQACATTEDALTEARRAGCSRAADAAAEHPGQRGASADERVGQPRHRRDAGGPDRRADERDQPGRRHHRRAGGWLRGCHPATGWHPRQLICVRE